MNTFQSLDQNQPFTFSEIINLIDIEMIENQLEEVSLEDISICTESILGDLEWDDISTSGQSPIWRAAHTFSIMTDSVYLAIIDEIPQLNQRYVLSATFTRMQDGSIHVIGELIYEIDGFSQESLPFERNSFDDFAMAA